MTTLRNGRTTELAGVDILILAGGLGTRLRGVLPDSPKILAPVLGKPFLEYLLSGLSAQGCRRFVLSLGYRAEAVTAWLETNRFPSLEVQTVTEPEPLGTGGALALASTALRSDPVLVINGDTVADVDLNEFLRCHIAADTAATMLCARVDDARRYGIIEIDSSERIVKFAEKDERVIGPQWINAGYYLFSQTLVGQIQRTLTTGSLERDVLERMPQGSVGAFRTEGRFLDIGTPETLREAADLLTGGMRARIEPGK